MACCVVHAISNSGCDDSCFYLIASNFCFMLRQLSDASLCFVPRTANQFVHCPSREALSLSDYKVWGGPFDTVLSSTLSLIVSNLI